MFSCDEDDFLISEPRFSSFEPFRPLECTKSFSIPEREQEEIKMMNKTSEK